jgi:hypothetical protein
MYTKPAATQNKIHHPFFEATHPPYDARQNITATTSFRPA